MADIEREAPRQKVERKYVYKALVDGTLSNPYCFVKAGQTVALLEPIKCTWLLPLDEYVEPEVLPTTATSAAQQSRSIPETGDVDDPRYTQDMGNIKIREEREDEIAKEKAEAKEETDGEGTGSTDVIG